jgi:hypothetical protein
MRAKELRRLRLLRRSDNGPPDGRPVPIPRRISHINSGPGPLEVRWGIRRSSMWN